MLPFSGVSVVHFEHVNGCCNATSMFETYGITNVQSYLGTKTIIFLEFSYEKLLQKWNDPRYSRKYLKSIYFWKDYRPRNILQKVWKKFVDTLFGCFFNTVKKLQNSVCRSKTPMQINIMNNYFRKKQAAQLKWGWAPNKQYNPES